MSLHRFALALALLTASAAAQISFLPNTGCAGAPNTPIGGQPAIGSTLTIGSDQFPCNSPQTMAYVLLGIGCNQLPPLQIGCRANPCTLLIPDLIFAKPISVIVTVPIPNNTSLVGFEFCAQGGCHTAFAGRNCLFTLNQIGRIKVTR